MARKPIQIAVAPFTLPGMEGFPAVPGAEVFALCDDGSIWSITGADGKWIPLPQISQRPTFDEWTTAIKNFLLTRHHIRRDFVPGFLEQNRVYLDGHYKAEAQAQDVAKMLAERIASSDQARGAVKE